MCNTVYIGSACELETIPWNETNPGFYVKRIDPYEMAYNAVKDLLQLEYIYFAGSYMGCSCGLYFYDVNENDDEDLEHRIRDLMSLKEYLEKSMPGNNMKLFMTWWDHFDYAYKELLVPTINPKHYIMEQDIVYTLKM